MPATFYDIALQTGTVLLLTRTVRFAREPSRQSVEMAAVPTWVAVRCELSRFETAGEASFRHL